MKQRKKSILFFVEPFFPPTYLPRNRYFYSYFVKKGWNVDVITEYSDYLEQINNELIPFSINYYKYKQGFASKLEWLFKFIINLFFDHKGNYFYKKSKYIWSAKKYDLVLCSTCYTFPLSAAEKVAEKLNLPLFVDLRDIVEQSPSDNYLIDHKLPKIGGTFIGNLYKRINLKRRNNVLKKAKSIITVSPWHVKTISKFNSDTHLIYNGFDESKFIPQKFITGRFTISYFGRLYSESMRSPRLLFMALEKLREKQLITSKDLVVKWFVDKRSKNVILDVAKDYNIEDVIEIQDFVKQEELPDKMNESSILLTISTSKNYYGIMTTKLFESIGVNKPILCFPDNYDLLSDFIKKNNCGIVSSDAQIIENFILEKFNIWKKEGYVKGQLNQENRMEFSRRNGAQKLENIILKELV